MTASRPQPAPAQTAGRGVRERLLDAAEARLLERGPAGLVLSQVAADAGCSKGGLLYHFPTKEALVDGLIERMLDSFDDVQSRLAAADGEGEGEGEGRGCWSRAYLASTVTDDGRPADGSAQLMAGLLAVVGDDPDELAPLRERFGAWHARLEQDGIDPETAIIVRLAADGLWLSALLGLPSPPPERLARVVARLREMTRTRAPL